MKRCPACGVDCPVEQFHKSRSTRDGLDRTCKDCSRLRKADQYLRNRDRMLARNQAWKDRSREHISAYNAAHYASNLTKYQARAAVQRALAAGVLVKADACERCGAPGDLQGHHNSYAREHWLCVEWLCRSCHLRHHAMEKSA